MALLLRDLALDLAVAEETLPAHVAERLGLAQQDVQNLCIVRRSIDARKKSRIRKVYTLRFSCPDEPTLLKKHPPSVLEPAPDLMVIPVRHVPGGHRVLVVGMGPAGLFAAKLLAESGCCVTLIERGRPVEQRIRDVETFWTSGCLEPASNVQFGEGGAGTFSDGKLTTRLNHPYRHAVLETLVACGAPEEILIEARPHVGSDRLRKVLVNFRKLLARLGVEIRFETCLTGLETHRGRVAGGVTNQEDLIPCDALVLAPGHSARDTYEMLDRAGVLLEPKGFAVGVRVEHPAELINRIQYGCYATQLPAADYALRYNDAVSGRGVYSFCMCPGGEVINAASEAEGLVVNGMSRLARSGVFSNSALVVSVTPDDWGGSRLGGISFQRKWERLAYIAGGRGYRAPAQNMMNFAGRGTGNIMSTCRPGVVAAELREVLPDFVYHGLTGALPHFDRKMKGFLTVEATLIGVETRTSAPLRIRRTDSGESLSHPGLYPAGEGAGYAGGIMSAAFDGLRAAEQVVQSVLGRELL